MSELETVIAAAVLTARFAGERVNAVTRRTAEESIAPAVAEAVRGWVAAELLARCVDLNEEIDSEGVSAAAVEILQAKIDALYEAADAYRHGGAS